MKLLALLVLLAIRSFYVTLLTTVSAFALFLATPAEDHRFASENLAATLAVSFGMAIVSIVSASFWIGIMSMLGGDDARHLLAMMGLSFLPIMGVSVAVAATVFYRVTVPCGLRFSLFFFTTTSLLLYIHPYHASQRVYFLPIQSLAIEEDLST